MRTTALIILCLASLSLLIPTAHAQTQPADELSDAFKMIFAIGAVMIVGALVFFILLVRRFGFVATIGIFMVMYGAYGLYQAYTNPEPSNLFGIPFYAGFEGPMQMVMPAAILLVGVVVYKMGRDRRRD